MPTSHYATQELISTGQFLAARGWAPATAGNYSMHLGNGEIAVTQSGRWKGALTPADIMTVDLNGNPTSEGKPSDETLLHTTIYKLFPSTGAILHTHSIPCTTLTRHFKNKREMIFEGYELQKAYPDIKTHEGRIFLPIFDNAQDMMLLADQISRIYSKANNDIVPAFLLRGHGLYGWANDMSGAKKVVEATEFMLSCELETLKIVR